MSGFHLLIFSLEFNFPHDVEKSKEGPFLGTKHYV